MKIKLVIWDLDNTLWAGILDEGEVTPYPERIRIIKELNDRGVVNSVCSKNDFQKAAAKIREMTLSDELIFPEISWEPKGPKVKSIIDSFQLRPENVLFVDDEESNLSEVAFYNAKINTINSRSENVASVLTGIMAENRLDGRRRFNQYRSLERKSIARKDFSDNKQFLRESRIVVFLDRRCELYLERIDELINRTNQLNFTKERLTLDELKLLLQGGNENFVVFAKDKFGDYGLIGFVSLNRSANELDQFVFSCRILNMGVEQYIYRKLEFPAIKIVGEVSTRLIDDREIDWIQESRVPYYGTVQSPERAPRILIAGGCDLYQTSHFLKSEAKVETYFNYASKEYGIELHKDSLIYLYASKHYSRSQQETVMENFPFVEPDFFVFPELDNYDLVIYSPLVDYLQNTYAFKEDSKTVISWGDFTSPTGNICDEKEFLNSIGLSDARILEISSKWVSLGPISPGDFLDKLKAVFEGYSGKLILLGGASKYVPIDQRKYLPQHLKLNEVLKVYQKERPGTYYLNIDDLLTSTVDFVNSIRHYQRAVHSRIAQRIVEYAFGLEQKTAFEVVVSDVIERIMRIAHRLGF